MAFLQLLLVVSNDMPSIRGADKRTAGQWRELVDDLLLRGLASHFSLTSAARWAGSTAASWCAASSESSTEITSLPNCSASSEARLGPTPGMRPERYDRKDASTRGTVPVEISALIQASVLLEVLMKAE